MPLEVRRQKLDLAPNGSSDKKEWVQPNPWYSGIKHLLFIDLS
jgi:hypothetical protein